MTLETLGIQAKQAERELLKLNSLKKNACLMAAAKGLVAAQADILKANAEDVRIAREKGMKESLVDRLALTEERIASMAEGLASLVALEDPIGEILEAKIRPNGLEIGKKRVPLGVIGIIYESRPNVTADAFGLCFKTSNAVILKGGSDAIHSNKAIVKVIREVLSDQRVTPDAIQLVEDTRRETAKELMRMNRYLDVLIPRGGAGLIRTVVENSTVPVIETGTGNCHIYVDATADIQMAVDIIDNAKTQRTGVCNA